MASKAIGFRTLMLPIASWGGGAIIVLRNARKDPYNIQTLRRLLYRAKAIGYTRSPPKRLNQARLLTIPTVRKIDFPPRPTNMAGNRNYVVFSQITVLPNGMPKSQFWFYLLPNFGGGYLSFFGARCKIQAKCIFISGYFNISLYINILRAMKMTRETLKTIRKVRKKTRLLNLTPHRRTKKSKRKKSQAIMPNMSMRPISPVRFRPRPHFSLSNFFAEWVQLHITVQKDTHRQKA